MGYDIRDVLPAIFQDDEATAQVRIDYFDWWSRRFSEAFFGQIRQWSARNGLWSIGHLGGEDLTIGSRKYGFGHVMRVLRQYDIPGVDTIWKQVHPGRKAVLPVHWDDAEGSLPVSDNHHELAKFGGRRVERLVDVHPANAPACACAGGTWRTALSIS